MSSVWIILLGLLICERSTFGALPSAESTHYRLRSTNLPELKTTPVARQTSRRIVPISISQKIALRTGKYRSGEAFNNSISTSDTADYNIWQALKTDGKANFYILFFTIYISYLVYVLF
uniref:Uncharacterized protein n=1 Tax=Drosophila melanogaster TaxID=7227 RepID=X2JD74_DROME|nr:uncharacterized protein Dmel_CG45116 [Drosophila melanogaster]AHN58172.1 uncharacterized protein Dmel_CG45116 [Drosophila melanogaster]|eukprot:NP_001287147.1 uncharacterized protein Dmel_CG45116 [Drosophila melanogaster]